MFNLNLDTVSDSATIAESIYQSYYPNGQQIVKNTSYYSKDFGNNLTRERTLSTRSLSDALSGEVLYRNPKFSTTFYNKGLNSSLNSLLTGGSEAAFTSGASYKIDNPESTVTSSTLTGGAALARVVLDSLSGKSAASEFVSRASDSIANDYSTIKSYPALFSGNGDDHASVPDIPPDGGASSGGAREVVFVNNISAEEKVWLIERANILKGLEVTQGWERPLLVSGYDFDLPDSVSDISSTKSYFPGATNTSSVSSSTIKAGRQKVFVCPAMMESLIYLNSKIKIKGGLGLQRGTSSQGPNLSTLQTGSSISDHPFGRAFDISFIGTLDARVSVNLSNEGLDHDKHKRALDILLEALNTAPTHLIPDLIVFSPKVGQTYGIANGGEGFEAETTKIKQEYPGLKYVNFSLDANHQTHIHISFSAARAGIYSGPGGQMGGIAAASGTGSAGTDTSDTSKTRSARTSSAPRRAEFADVGPDASVGPNTPPPTDLAQTPSTDSITSSSETGSTGLNFLSFIREIRSNNPFAPKNKTSTNQDGTSGLSAPGDFVIPGDLNDAKFTKDYSKDRSAALQPADIFALLRLTVMSDEAAALFAAIAKREGGMRPGAFLCLNSSGDWSFGLWGINMLPNANGTKTYSVPAPSSKTALGWQLGYRDWEKDDIDAGNFRSKAFAKLSSIGGKDQAWQLWDPVVWYPINQAYILATVITGKPFDGNKLGQVAESGYLFFPWGDYGGGPPYGWISNVEFSLAAQLYTSLGKSEEALKKWVLDMFKGNGSGSDSAPYAAKWVEGYMYKVRWSSGWEALGEFPP